MELCAVTVGGISSGLLQVRKVLTRTVFREEAVQLGDVLVCRILAVNPIHRILKYSTLIQILHVREVLVHYLRVYECVEFFREFFIVNTHGQGFEKLIVR